MTNQSKKSGLKNILTILSIAIPSLITFQYYQSLFELNFNFFSNEQLLILIPGDAGMALFILGIFTFFGGLVGSFVAKQPKTKQRTLLMMPIGIILAFVGLQNYKAFTEDRIIESKTLIVSKTYHQYSDIDKMEIETNMSVHSGTRNYGLNCSPRFKITGLLNPYKKVLTVHVSDADKHLVYKLMDILEGKDIPVQTTLLNNCMNHPDQFKAFEEEFNHGI